MKTEKCLLCGAEHEKRDRIKELQDNGRRALPFMLVALLAGGGIGLLIGLVIGLVIA